MSDWSGWIIERSKRVNRADVWVNGTDKGVNEWVHGRENEWADEWMNGMGKSIIGLMSERENEWIEPVKEWPVRMNVEFWRYQEENERYISCWTPNIHIKRVSDSQFGRFGNVWRRSRITNMVITNGYRDGAQRKERVSKSMCVVFRSSLPLKKEAVRMEFCFAVCR